MKIPNEGVRSLREGARMKREGLSRGMPDLMLLIKRGEHGALFLELKRSSAQKCSPEQLAWLTWLNNHGYKACVVHGFDAAIRVIEDYVYAESSAKV